MSDRIKCKDCKWFKQNEYNEKTGYCHIVPPMWQGNGMNCKCFWAAVAIDDFCSKAEPREDVETEFIVAGKIEAGDAVYVIARDELEKMKEENHKLKEAKDELLIILKKTCTLYNINAQCQEYVDECKHGLAQSCSVFRTIQKYDGKDGEK